MNLRPPRVGLIPLYLALYDEVAPEYHNDMAGFARSVAEQLLGQGVEMKLADVCRTKAEVDSAVAELTAAGVDLLLTLHLSYSPSLEAADALTASKLPLALLDTTPHPRFADRATEEELMKNHGIHGVQDLASVLHRRGRSYDIIAGHLNDEEVMREVVETARAAQAAQALTSMKVLAVGEPFAGMGDFQVPADELESALGIQTVSVSPAELGGYLHAVTAGDVIAENELDLESYACPNLTPEVLTDSNRIGLAVRALLRDRDLGAFTANFNEFDPVLGLRTYPFLEACKAMARGVGYAGEGDVLTAAFVGSLLQAFGEVTFCEMFCPDWAENWLLMSHMGECNPALAADTPILVEKTFQFGNLQNPVVPIFTLRAGIATLVNLAPGPGGSFNLIAGRVRVLARELEPGLPNSPHFWIRTENMILRDFLTRFSLQGGTHHSALIYGDRALVMQRMAAMLGVNFYLINPEPVI